MLTNSHITTILPVVQMDRARRFYEEKLGLVPEGEHADGSFWMRGGDGSTVALIPRPDRKKADYTALSFEVANSTPRSRISSSAAWRSRTTICPT